jgi:hypothetical protein
LSDEEIENERPFMRGRVKLATEVIKARLQAKCTVSNVLSDKEWENERPFMHGRNRNKKEANERRRYIQLAPVLSHEELENERPFMKGRTPLSKQVTQQSRQRQLVALFSESNGKTEIEKENSTTSTVMVP